MERCQADIMEKKSNLFEKIKEDLSRAAESLVVPSEIKLEKAPDFAPSHDLACALGFQLSKAARKPPLEAARGVCERLKAAAPAWLESCEAKAPGFVNLRLRRVALESAALQPLVFSSAAGLPASVYLEYCSANPTGPLHFGHPRGAILGDTLARLYRSAGVQVHREYYINDVGGQIEKLAASLEARYKGQPIPEDGYPGEYLEEIARALPETAKNWSREEFAHAGKEAILKLIQKELSQIGVEFDAYYSESTLHEAGRVSGAVEELKEKGFAAEQDGAVLFKAKGLSEEDKERVLMRSNGKPTYFASDLAYHREKFKKNMDCYINIWGADHHGYVPRLKLGMEALGLPVERFHVILIQMVRLVKSGKAVTLSKRDGDYQTLGEIASQVGTDALRFFLNSRTPNAQLDFDMDLAMKKSAENPVYLIQYAHARIASIKREKEARGIHWPQEDNPPASGWLEEDPKSRALAASLGFLPEILLECLRFRSTHHLTQYLLDLAREFHGYYETHPVLSETRSELAWARYHLCAASASVIASGLSLLGISAPEKM